MTQKKLSKSGEIAPYLDDQEHLEPLDSEENATQLSHVSDSDNAERASSSETSVEPNQKIKQRKKRSKGNSSKNERKASNSSKKSKSMNPFSLIFSEIRNSSTSLSEEEKESKKKKSQLPPLPPNPNFFEVIATPENEHTKKTLIAGTVAMMTIPLTVYAILYCIVLKHWPLNSRIAWSVIGAVIGVQLVLAVYIWYALRVDRLEEEAKKDKKN